jgi:hypothetical protein
VARDPDALHRDADRLTGQLHGEDGLEKVVHGDQGAVGRPLQVVG